MNLSADRPDSLWASPLVSWSFLTTLPAPAVRVGPRSLAGAIALLPLVGALLGAALGLLGLALDHAFPPDLVAVVLLAISAVVTGGLHLDGLMDTADGLFGGATVERRLEIMRDSRVGSFGVIAGVLALLAEYATLSHLQGLVRLGVLVLSFGLSRWAMALAIGLFPPARAAGLGATFRAAAGVPSLVVATAIAAVVAALLGSTHPIFAASSLLLVALLVLAGGRFFVHRLGGLTGDTYGTLAVLAEVLVLFAATGVGIR